MWPSVIVKQKSGGTQHSAPFVLNCTPQLLQCFTINGRVYCCALGQKFYQENMSVPEYGAHDLPCWKRLLELFPFWRTSMLPVQALLFWFRCDMEHPCLVSCHSVAQHAVSFLVLAHQKCQNTCNMLFFMLLCEHLGHSLCTHFLITHITTDNVTESPWNLRKVQGQIRNCETLSSCTLSLTLRTKSSFTKDGRLLRASSCTFSHPSLNISTHFLTMPLLITLSPYTWQIWWWISLGSTFLAVKKWITGCISQSAAPSIVLNVFNTQEQT